MTEADQSPCEIRIALRAAGFSPIPVDGKIPHLTGWQQKLNATVEEIRAWDRRYPTHKNTGILTRDAPALDIDITNEPAAIAVEELARERWGDAGFFPVRIGRPPKRCLFFRCDAPFPKLTRLLVAPDGTKHKLEILCDGQQVVVDGIHPDTRKPYAWHGGELGKIKRADLARMSEAEALEFLEDAVELLVKEHGFTVEGAKAKANGKGNGGAHGERDRLVADIISGANYHDSIVKLAASYAADGMPAEDIERILKAAMYASQAEHDDRWKSRLDDIPRAVQSAVHKFRERKDAEYKATLARLTIDEVLEVFDKWLVLDNHTPIYAVLGAVAANYLSGIPVWLGLVAPGSSAKTEILGSLSLLPHIVKATTLSPAALLSGVPKRQFAKGARGGVLREIGSFGILVHKDFGSVLSMRPDLKAETLAAMREIYDGSWRRQLGTDGGITLPWEGKVGLLFGCTAVIDSHHSVIGSMGERFLMSRLSPKFGQLKKALDHKGNAEKTMRKELEEAVAGLFLTRVEPQPITDEESAWLESIVNLVVLLRGTVERDRITKEIQAVYGEEGTGRIGLTLERLLAGLSSLGVERSIALKVVESVAMDSVPPIRRRAYEHLADGREARTSQVGQALGLPTNTVRRALEDLAAYRLVERFKKDALDEDALEEGNDKGSDNRPDWWRVVV
jgi:hypothetical protein